MSNCKGHGLVPYYCSGPCVLARMTPKFPLVDRALVESELMDCRSQRDQQRQILTQAQQSAQVATYNIARLDGAEASYLALIQKIEEAEKAKKEGVE
jgi:hypothetical protein